MRWVRGSWRSRTAVVAIGIALTASYLVGETEAAWAAKVANTTNRTGTATLSYSHAYTGGPCSSSVASSPSLCPGAITPTAATVASPGVVTATDAITNTGTTTAANQTEQVQVSSCGPVSLANRVRTTNPMISRYGTAYAPTTGPLTGSGAIMLDGANPGGYEASIVAQSQPAPLLAVGTTYGLGIWFKTTSTAGGPLFGFGSSAINVSGSNDRILYMDKTGHLGFALNTAGAVTGLSPSAYNNGGWHFAYITLSQLTIVAGVVSTISLQVDGSQVATGGGLLVGLDSYSGYWHIGWSPISTKSYGTGLSNYFTGSLSNFAVLNTAPAPSTLAVATTQTGFNTSIAASVTEHWLLNDTGTTTFTGTLPVIGATNPCTMVNLSWGFTSPTSCGWSPPSTTAACTSPPAGSLAAFVAASWQTVASPAPAATQNATSTLR